MFACFLVAGTTLASFSLQAQTSVWRISDGDSDVYIAGTVHLLRQQDYPLPAAYDQAYVASERLFFETDIGGMSDMGLQQRMLRELTYQDGRSLSTVLDADSYAALSAYVESTGLPMAMLQNFKPGLLISTLSVLEFQKLGFTPQGVDSYYFTRALGDGKPRGELETIDEQIAMLAAMGEGYESEFVMYSVKDFSQIGESIERIVQAWRGGDTAALSAEFIEPMLEDTPVLYDSLLVRRNNNWMPQVEAMFTEDGTEFVLVGVAHLVGEHGLIEQLQNKGYDVTQLGFD
ncbi:MAG: TraB/GumN family protein [Pseudohongiella sp.]|nr:TraB/GumN family protein [Pseudohongiella sp.]MDO9519114.1 TraB/GumN family protein [Pseudohongiella sp.]MDP2129119.1 TraB/GumN family protein [Pseudohongiella sp.]